jgi:hypothetical protein
MKPVFVIDERADDFHASERCERLKELVGMGLQQLPSLGRLQPTLFVDAPPNYEIITFEQTDERSLRKLAADWLSSSSNAAAYVMEFEGILRSKSGELMVAVFEGAEAGMAHGYRWLGVQADEPSLIYHGHSDQLLPSTAASRAQGKSLISKFQNWLGRTKG